MNNKNLFFLKISLAAIIFIAGFLVLTNQAQAAYRISYDGTSFVVDSLQINVEWNAVGCGHYGWPWIAVNGSIRQYDGFDYCINMCHYYCLDIESSDPNCIYNCILSEVLKFSATLQVGQNSFEIASNNERCDFCGCPFGWGIVCDGVYAKITFSNGRVLYTDGRWDDLGIQIIDISHCGYPHYLNTVVCRDCCEVRVRKTITVEQLTNNASCGGISAPNSVTSGQTFSASVTMRNTGNKSWTSDSTPHRLGSQNPQDNLRWGLSRVSLPWQPVNSGQSVTFNFTATAPTTPGTYPFDWKMVEDGIEWFGATCQKTITVVGPPSCSISASPNPCSISCGGSTCNSTISWSSQNVADGKVTVRRPTDLPGSGTGGLFSEAENSSGQVAPWIDATGYVFDFVNKANNQVVCSSPRVYGTLSSPPGPSLVSPSNGSNIGTAPQTPTFRWNDVACEDGYWVDLCTTSNCSSYTNKQVPANTTQTTWGSALSAGTYWWRVYAYNSAGGNHSSIWSFTVSPVINQAPVAVATISKNGINFSKSIIVTRGVATPIWLSAEGSSDPNGWTDPTNGVSNGGKCQWNSDLNQGAPTFETTINNPPTPSYCNIYLGNLTFNDTPGTYTYQVLRITDRQGAVSNIDTVSVTVQAPPNRPPNKPQPVGEGETWNHCAIQGLSIPTFRWTYSDPDGNPQAASHLRIYGQTTLDTGEISCLPTCTSYSPTYEWIRNNLNWGQAYSWQVRVKDNQGNWSEWSDTNSFTMPPHAYPWPDFSWKPQEPSPGEIVQFTDKSTVYGGATKVSWFWTFQDGSPPNSSKQNATTTFTSAGPKTVTLRVTDSSGFACTEQKTINAQFPLPEYKEVPPGGWLKKFLASILELFKDFIKITLK